MNDRPPERTRVLVLALLVVVGAGLVAWWWQGRETPLPTSPASGALVPITPILVGESQALPAVTPFARSPVAGSTEAPESSADTTLQVVPQTTFPGSVVFMEGRGFGPSEVVLVSVATSASSPSVVRAGTDEEGAFRLPYQVAEESPLGDYRVEAVGQTSGRRAHATFTVADVPTPTPIVIQIETTLATATPEVLVSPVAVPLYQVVSTLGGIDCQWYGFFGHVYNPDGSPRPNVGVRIFHQAADGTFVGGTATTNAEGYWEVFLGTEVGPDLVGLWHLVVVEGEQRGSAEIALEMPASCRENKPTKFQIDWQRSVP